MQRKLIILYFFISIFYLTILYSQNLKKISSKNEEDLVKEEEYRTPRAGESLKGSLLGIEINVPARERDKVTAITLGAAIYSPKIGDNSILPFAAFYYFNTWEEKRRRIRAVLALFVNYINFYDSTWNDYGFEVALSWENYTIPFPSSLVIENSDIEDSEIYWGYIRGGIGLGWKKQIAPYQIDSYFSIYLYYEPGFLYFDGTDNTADNYILPPETYEDRFHLKIRVDAMERNIMEMRHQGWAGGIDVIRGHRYNWRDHDFNGSFEESDTQRYWLFTGYITFAGGPKWLSEKHRFILSIYGGYSFGKNLDRYSAPRLGGGPGGDETEALARLPIPGAKFDEFIVNRYLLFYFEYRLELLFFMYLHIKGVIGPIRRMAFKENLEEVSISRNEIVGSLGVGFTTGFIWDSQIYLEYVHDWGVLRAKEKERGHNFLICWSKSF